MTSIATQHVSRKGYADSAFGQVHYISAAPKEPDTSKLPLVLLHQNPSSSRMWESVLPGFAAAGYRTYALDTPGYGMSDRPTEQPDMHYYADRQLEAIDSLGIGDFYLLGHHTGAMIAAHIAVQHPDRVKKLVLSGYPLMDPERRNRLGTAEPRVFTEQGDEVTMLWQRNKNVFGDCYTPDLGVRFMIEKLQAGPLWFWGYHAVAGADDAGLLRKITMPTLSLCGDKDMAYGGAVEAVDLLAHGTLVTLPGAGIFPADDDPAAYVAAVTSFLDGDR